MNTIDQALGRIFERSGYVRKDGQPLYQYRLNNDELAAIRGLVSVEFQRQPRPERSDVCAAFCLFAAEWFRRNHEDGPWKWEPIFTSGLGLTSDAVRLAASQSNISKMVRLGLQWWNLPLVETESSTRYLVSLACQGGLPLKTLKKDQGNLKKFFEDTLSHHERWTTEPLNDVVSRYAESLPVSLNNDVVIQLGVLIVSAVARLRRESKSASDSASTRMAYLDQHSPKWRDSLPLRLDEEDQDQLQLLMGLLDRTKVKPATDDFPKVETYISLGYATGKLSRKLCAGTEIEEDALWRFLGLQGKECLRPRMTLNLVSGSVKTLVAKLAKRATEAKFTINTVPGNVSGAGARNELRVTAAFGPESTPAVHLAGGQELGDVPWIFGDPDEKMSTYRLIGLGSVRTRRESVLVVVPENSTWSHEGDLEVLPQTVDGRKIVRLSGSLEVVLEDATFRIRTKQPEDSSSLFWLTGRQVVCGTGGSAVWAGSPRILEVSVDGTVQEVPSRLVQWRYEGGPNEWRAGLSGCLGHVKVRVVREGVTVFQQMLNIFPRDFSVRVLPTDSSRGRLVLRRLGNDAKVFVSPDERLNCSIRASDGETSIEVAAMSVDRPEFVSIRVVFEHHGASELQMPCPTTWVGLIDAAGRVFSPGRDVPLASLKRLTLRVISPRPQTPQLQAEKKGGLVFLANLRAAELDSKDTFELPMSVVETRVAGMMSATTDLDDQVHLFVTQGVSSEPIYKVSISRYPGALEKVERSSAEGEEGDFTDIVFSEERARVLRVDEAQIRIELSPLSQPDRPYEGDECRKIAPGLWRVFHDQLNSGPCLVTAWLDDFTCLRPLRISVRSENKSAEDRDLDPGSVEELGRVSRIWNGAERRSEWKQLIDNLSNNFEAPSWSCIDAMLKSSEHRPMTTFEALVALVQNPLAMARTAIIHARRQWIWDRFEELPFLWCLIPVRCWTKAALTIRESMRTKLSGCGFSEEKVDEMLLTQLRNFLEGGLGRPSVLSAAAACLRVADDTIAHDSSVAQLHHNGVSKLLYERELERTRLISAHDGIDTRISWPHYDVPIAHELQKEISDLLISDCHVNQRAVLNGPLAAAAHSVYGVDVTEEQLNRFQELRGIDADWFDRCFEISSFILAGRRLKKEGRDWLLES